MGPKTTSTATGPVAVLEFAMTSASFTSLDVKLPCAGHASLELYQPGTSGVSSSGALTLDVVSFQATIGGAGVTYTPASPPSAPPLPSGSGTLTNLSVVATTTTMSTLTVTGLAVRTNLC